MITTQTRKQQIGTVADICAKIGATIKQFHHITDAGNDIMLAEVELDGGEKRTWDLPFTFPVSRSNYLPF